MSLPRPVSPRAAFADLRAFVAQKTPHRIVFLALAIGVAALLGMAFWASWPVPNYQEPDIVYVQQWDSTRTGADVRAQQALDAPREIAAEKARQAAALKRQREYQRLAKQLGVD